MSGSGKLAVQVKGVRLDRTLHLADVEAFWPAVRHFVRPLTQTAIAREEYGDLCFLCTTTTLPAFGLDCQSSSGGNVVTESGEQPAPRRIGKASPSVSIFSRDPLCKNTCRYCRCRPCDVGVEHDDHTCYSCEQRLLHPDGVPGAPWQPPLTPGCESWCVQCTSQRCAVRGLHELHVCMDCEHTMKFSTAVGGGDPWAAPE